MPRRVFLLILAAFSFLTPGCFETRSPSEQVARRFMEHYYVKADLKSVVEVSDGYALERVRESLRLTEGQGIDRTTHRPKISYRLVNSSQDGLQATYLFEVLIEPEKVKAITRKTRLKLREREAGKWKVTQFSDHE